MASIVRGVWQLLPQKQLNVFTIPCFFDKLDVKQTEAFLHHARDGTFFIFSDEENRLFVSLKNNNQTIIIDLNYNQTNETFMLHNHIYHKSEVMKFMDDFKQQFVFPLNSHYCTPH